MKCIEDIMTRDIRQARTDTTLREAARMMRDYSVGCLPVVEDGRIVGLLTDRDIVLRAVAEGRAPDSVTAREAMTNKPVTVRADQSIAEAAVIMRRRAIRRLVATDADGRPVGIVSIGDLAAARDDHETEAAAEKVFHSRCCAAK